MSHIKVYRFHDAPYSLKKLSTNGGDEDWIAIVPRNIWEKEHGYIGWLESGSSFGCCNVDMFEFENFLVFIGSHA